ncbi:MAG: hypothetical protein HeimC3_54250 [Candidatus Heimdallarchaeota archaeon LC_3]|nr:MAG: hypothetical protein HeimC3_54250 [Candidatus Heimdallarchaeota archaeon LC_3]
MSIITDHNSDSLQINLTFLGLDINHFENDDNIWPLTFIFLFKDLLSSTISLKNLSTSIKRFYNELNSNYGTNLYCNEEIVFESLKDLEKQNYLKFESESFYLTDSGIDIAHKTAHQFLNHFKSALKLN